MASRSKTLGISPRPMLNSKEITAPKNKIGYKINGLLRNHNSSFQPRISKINQNQGGIRALA